MSDHGDVATELSDAYRGYVILVWLAGGAPYRWCYSIDVGSTARGNVAFESATKALLDGRNAARATIDALLAH